MTQRERERFVNALVRNVKKEIIEKTKSRRFPKEWDGIELRWLVKEAFQGVVFGGYRDKRARRFREFENECLVYNLYP